MIFQYIPHTNNEDMEVQLIQRYSLSTGKLKVKSKNIAHQILLGCRQERAYDILCQNQYTAKRSQQKIPRKDIERLTEQSTVGFFLFVLLFVCFLIFPMFSTNLSVSH